MQQVENDRIGLRHDVAHDIEKAVQIGRRSFVGALLGACSMLVGAIIGTPLLRYVLYPVYAKNSNDERWSNVGEVKEFDVLPEPASKTIRFVQLDGWREVVTSQSVYVTRGPDKQLLVMSATCPHLGCSVAWQPSQNKFVCPCHGGQFNSDGKHISGPPPRGLDCLQSKVKDGKLLVHFDYFRPNSPNQEAMD